LSIVDRGFKAVKRINEEGKCKAELTVSVSWSMIIVAGLGAPDMAMI
jgi:hypothetical protein